MQTAGLLLALLAAAGSLASESKLLPALVVCLCSPLTRAFLPTVLIRLPNDCVMSYSYPSYHQVVGVQDKCAASRVGALLVPSCHTTTRSQA